MRSKPIIACILLFSGSAFAVDVEVMEVTAVQQPSAGETQLTNFTGSYQLIDASALARPDASLAEIIAHEPGVQFRQAGGLGGYSTISMRAATSAQTGIYLDGVLLNDAGTGSVNLAELELLNVGSVEIFRGSTPIQLGQASLGGGVNLRSPSIEDNSVGLLAGFGTFGSQRCQLSKQMVSDDWDFIAAISHQSSNNDFKFLNDNGTQLYSGDDTTQSRYNSDFSRNSLLTKLGYYPSEDISYQTVLQVSQRDQGVPEWRNRKDNRASWDTDNTQFQIQRRYQASEDTSWNSAQTVFINTREEVYDDRLSQVGLDVQHQFTDTLVYGVKGVWDKAWNEKTLGLTGEIRQEALDSDDRLRNADFDADRLQLSLSAQHGLSSLQDKLLFTTSLRYQSTRDSYSGVLRGGDDSRNTDHLTLQTGFRYQHKPQWAVRGNLGNYKREPGFFELFGDRGLFVGNEDLEAEAGINADLGLHWIHPDSKDRNASATLFSGWRDELITAVYDSQGIGRSENTGKARSVGLELQGNWQFSPRWNTRLNVTWQDTENQSDFRAYSGKQLPGEGELSVYTRLQYTRDRWNGWYEIDAISDRYYDSPNLLRAEDQILHNVGVSYTHKVLSATLALHNLGNDNVEDFNGFPKPGKAAFLTMTYKFDGEQTR